jgi:hypothetical protein
LSFQAFGAPQWHNQRVSQQKISTYQEENSSLPFQVNGKKFNADFGYRDGKVYGGASGYNVYHKPQMSLNHYWTIDETSALSTAVYASIGTGSGRRTAGSYRYNPLQWYNGAPNNANFITYDGHLDFDAAIADNMTSDTAKIFMSNQLNNHKWYGLLSSYNKSINNFNITAGVDAKYYVGKHGMEIADLLGGKYYIDNVTNLNRPASAQLKVGDMYSWQQDGIVSWLGVFAQTEYVRDNYSAFLSASVASNNYRRKDYFNYTEGNQLSEKVKFTPFSVKGGFNYNLNDHNNLFINAGYFTRTPYFDNAFLNYRNDINPDAKMEKIISGEIGYGFTSSIFKAKLNAYITNWKDKTIPPRTYNNTVANIPGLNALHKGIELEMQFNPVAKLLITGMLSLGDWVWQDDVVFKVYDENQNLQGEYNAYIKNVHVGNSAQHTAFLGLDYDVFKSIRIGANINYFGKHYAEFLPTNRTDADNNGDSWKLPNAAVIDLNVRWNFKIGGLGATLYGNVDNLFNKEYISDATDGNDHDMNTALVFYGFGRTWTTGIRINF